MQGFICFAALVCKEPETVSFVSCVSNQEYHRKKGPAALEHMTAMPK